MPQRQGQSQSFLNPSRIHPTIMQKTLSLVFFGQKSEQYTRSRRGSKPTQSILAISVRGTELWSEDLSQALKYPLFKKRLNRVPNIKVLPKNSFTIGWTEGANCLSNESSDGSEIILIVRLDVVEHAFLLGWVDRRVDDNPNVNSTTG